MENFNIRISNETDFERIFEIWLENQTEAIGKQVQPAIIGKLKEDLFYLFSKTPSSIFYVAEAAPDQIIGWQSLIPLFANPLMSKYAAQSSTYVDKKFLNVDVGTALVKYAVTDAKRLGIDHIYGWVRADNHATNKIAGNFKTHKFFIPHSDSENLGDYNLYILVVE